MFYIRFHFFLLASRATKPISSRRKHARTRIASDFLTPPATAERSVAAALRIWFTPRGFLYLFIFFTEIFSESSEPIGL
jgi:hypothetical protein